MSQRQNNPLHELLTPCGHCGRHGLKKPGWTTQEILDFGHEQRGHHPCYFPGWRQDLENYTAPCHGVRFRFCHPNGSCVSTHKLPEACRRQARVLESQQQRPPAVFRGGKQALFRFRKAQGGKCVQYLSFLSRQAPRTSRVLS